MTGLLADQRAKLGLAAVLLVVIIAAGVWYSQKGKPEEVEVAPEITLEPTKQMETKLQPAMTEAEKQEIEQAFVKQGMEMTMLKDVSGGQAVGTAWRQYDDSRFYHKLEANNLSSLDKGYYYEGWLVGDQGFFSTGRLAVIEGKGTLYYKADEDKSSFRGVVVTQEPEDGDPAPDQHILEGSF